MNKILQKLICIALVFMGYVAGAQTTGSVTGKVLNGKDKSAVDYASVAVKRISDSTTVGGINSGTTGSFTISGLAIGKYRLYVAYLGLKSINQEFEVTAAKPNVNLGNLIMEDTGVTLQGVTVKGEIPPVVVKKDTLEISASTLKVKENAVVEDLLKKVPGVEVSKDGTITTQGETIKRVRVDGKDFMGSDPLLATRNLPADMVDKIQIIDDMSEQAKFSGVDDGNREKIINITTKNGVKNKGYVGNNTIGYGTDDRYDANISVNRFDKSQQISLIGQFNNVNKQNFGGGGGGPGGGRGMQFSNSGPQQGIKTTNSIGLNFADVYDDKTEINGSYLFAKTSLLDVQNSFTQNFLGNSTTTNASDLNRTTKNLQHRLNFMVDTKLDSSTTIRVQPSINYTENNLTSLSNYNNQSLNANTIGLQRLATSSSSPTITNNILIRKRFLRRGRTLSLNVNTNINDSDSENFNFNPVTITDPSGTVQIPRDQLNERTANSFSNTARLVYTEPLSKTLSLELNYQNGYSFDDSERVVYDFNSATQSYDQRVANLSNLFENTTLSNSIGFSFNKTEKKYNWNIGIGVQNTDRKNVNKTTGDVFNRSFINLTPSAQYRYTFSNTKRLNIRYDGNTQQPSITQIQPIPDNTNTQLVFLGNPNLKPSFVNRFRIFYNNFDYASYRTLFIGAFVTQTFNAIANSQTLIVNAADENYGKIANSYENVDGNFSANLFGNLGQPIIKGNKLTLNISLSGSYAKSTNFTNTFKNLTTDYSVSNGYKLISNLDKLDLIAGISGTMFRSTYSAQQGNNTRYYTLAPNFDVSYLLPGNIRIQTDLTYNQVTGRGQGFDTNYTLVNGFISRQFFNNRGTFKLSAYDLFNQNTGITRTSANNRIEDLNFNVLKRYYMLSFTYSLNKLGATIGGRTMDGSGGGQRMRMGGM